MCKKKWNIYTWILKKVYSNPRNSTQGHPQYTELPLFVVRVQKCNWKAVRLSTGPECRPSPPAWSITPILSHYLEKWHQSFHAHLIYNSGWSVLSLISADLSLIYSYRCRWVFRSKGLYGVHQCPLCEPPIWYGSSWYCADVLLHITNTKSFKMTLCDFVGWK